jgi:hypothetical protein
VGEGEAKGLTVRMATGATATGATANESMKVAGFAPARYRGSFSERDFSLEDRCRATYLYTLSLA